MSESKSYVMHVVSHTHWDREWYRPFQHFRMRLVEMMDYLLHLMESDPEYKFFHLDGQTIMLDDYLAVRPENEGRLRKLVGEGRILIGPWYLQPDEFLVSGEAMIRNLMIGRKAGDDWGNWMRIGYVPDCFGHISQLPQILRGFGMDNAVLFRGITTDQVDSEFIWRGADSSEVLCVKMPDDNAYSNFLYTLKDTLSRADTGATPELLEQARREIAELVADCERENPTTDHLLFMDGVDHVFPNPLVPAIIRDANENLPFGKMIHSTLPDFVEAVKAADPELETYDGELRISNRKWKLQALLQGVMSSRIHLKQANHEIQTLLEKWAEPFCTVAWMLGKEYPKSYLDLAWDYLLKNHPHDSICGCSVDQVHKDMIYGFDQARLIAEPLVTKSLTYLADKVDTSQANGADSIALVVFNPLSWERSEVVEANVNLPNDWNVKGLQVFDSEGDEVPAQVLESRQGSLFDQEWFDIPVGQPTKFFRIAFLAEGVPSVGYKTFYVKALNTRYRYPGNMVKDSATVENEHFAVVSWKGVMQVSGRGDLEYVKVNQLIFEDGGDFGDGWNYRKPARDTVVTGIDNQIQVSVIEDGPVKATTRIETTLRVPAAGHPNRQERGRETVDLNIASYITVLKGARRLDIMTEVDNNARDHRLRVIFPTGTWSPETDASYAEGLFDVVKRPIRLPDCRDWKEPMPGTHPQKSFVDVSDGKSGLTVINQGLPEFEVLGDGERNIALTLMRCVQGGVGGPENQEQGQLIGKHTFQYAIYPHKGDWEQAQVWREAWAHNVPMRVIQTGVHAGNLPTARRFLSIEEPGVLLSALKKADRESRIVARVFNITNAPAACKVEIAGCTDTAAADLNEEEIGAVPAEIGPKKIITILTRKD